MQPKDSRMRIKTVVAATLAIWCSGCASTSTQVLAPKGLGAKQEAADRAHCRQVGEATRNDPKIKEKIDEHVSAGVVGAALGGGLIGLAVAGSQQDQSRANFATAYAVQTTRTCLINKGYKPEGS
jgi:Flp pilus assembly protein TadD